MSGRISAIVQLINPGVTGRGRMGDRAWIQGQSPVFLLGMSGIALVAGSKLTEEADSGSNLLSEDPVVGVLLPFE